MKHLLAVRSAKMGSLIMSLMMYFYWHLKGSNFPNHCLKTVMELNVLFFLFCSLMIFPVPSLYQRAFLFPGEESSSWAWMSCLCVNPSGWSSSGCNNPRLAAAGWCHTQPWLTSRSQLGALVFPGIHCYSVLFSQEKHNCSLPSRKATLLKMPVLLTEHPVWLEAEGEK